MHQGFEKSNKNLGFELKPRTWVEIWNPSCITSLTQVGLGKKIWVPFGMGACKKYHIRVYAIEVILPRQQIINLVQLLYKISIVIIVYPKSFQQWDNMLCDNIQE